MRIREAYSFDDLLLIPQQGVLESRKDADISSEVVPDWPLLVPIISANMPAVTEDKMVFAMHCAGATGAIHRFNTIQEQEDIWTKYRLGIVSIGLKDGMERTAALAGVGAKVFLLDVAHAYTQVGLKFVKQWREEFPEYYLIVGNVVTSEACSEFADLGVDAIKVGIGPGAACTTREVTGFGFPQLSAISFCAGVKRFYDVRIIADGGIRNSGDIVKSLAAGADTVMVGRLLAGCDEAPNPGEYFGNASYKMNKHHAPEGIEGKVAKTGSVANVVKQLAYGIRSGLSYGGATNIAELREKAQWVKVTPQSLMESGTRLE